MECNRDQDQICFEYRFIRIFTPLQICFEFRFIIILTSLYTRPYHIHLDEMFVVCYTKIFRLAFVGFRDQWCTLAFVTLACNRVQYQVKFLSVFVCLI